MKTDKTKLELHEIANLIGEHVRRAYQLGYRDGVEDALNAVREENGGKEEGYLNYGTENSESWN